MIFSGFISNEFEEIAKKGESFRERLQLSIIKAALRIISNTTIFSIALASIILVIHIS